MIDTTPYDSFAAKPHVLVVDDDDRIRSLIRRYLTKEGFVVSEAADAAEAKEILRVFSYDVLVVDVMMPGQNGRDFTTELRQTQDVPVILLTAMSEAEDRISGLETGADDYLTKPFEPRELVLRLQAILRRKPTPKTKAIERLRLGDRVCDLTQRDVRNEEGRALLKLTESEAKMLAALAAHMGDVVGREALSAACGLDPDNRTVDVQITRLRRKIEDDSANPRILQTVRGKGYILRGEILP